jgi:site-specific recombinase XerD
MPDDRHLTRRHGGNGTWYAVLSVPKNLQPFILSPNGRPMRHLLKSLGTTDKATARQRKYAALAEFQTILNRARQQTGQDSIMDTALAWRQTVQRLDAGDLSRFWVHPPPPPGTDLRSLALGLANDDIERTADEIASSHSPTLAQAFYGIASGTATPLAQHIDSWLAEGGRKGPLNQRTKNQYRSTLAIFADWCRHAGIPPTIEAVTKPVAGRFVTEHFVSRAIDPRTSNKHITCLSSYWGWLMKRTGVEVNPWAGQSRSRAPLRNGEKSKREFADQEMLTLLHGNADIELDDAIRIAALSGMRREEIYTLTVADCANGVFDIRRSKTTAGVRKVPIHSALTAIVSRRTEGKAPIDYLFHEAVMPPIGQDRGMAMGQRFIRYRRRLGVDDCEPGQRHSRVDYHSFRRWFVTQARQAGIDRAVVASLVGHETGFITDDVYSGGPSMEQRRACVEAVRLPVG